MEKRFLREAEILQRYPFGKTTLWKMVADGTFPKPVKLGPRMSVWSVAVLNEWDAQVIEQQVAVNQ